MDVSRVPLTMIKRTCRAVILSFAGMRNKAYLLDFLAHPPRSCLSAGLAKFKRKPTFDIGTVIAAQGNAAPKANVVATYDYTDDKGGLLYQVVRYEPKSFRQRRPDEGAKAFESASFSAA
jgi:hypothetical protein